MDKMDRKQLEEYLRIVLDVQTIHLLLEQLENKISESGAQRKHKQWLKSMANNDPFIRNGFYILCCLAFLFFLIIWIGIFVIWGGCLVLGWTVFDLKWWPLILLAELVLLAILIYFECLWFHLMTFPLDLMKEVKQEVGMKNALQTNRNELANRRYSWNEERLILRETEEIRQLWEEEWHPFSYDVRRRGVKNVLKYGDLVRIASLYEYISSGKCSSLEGDDGAYQLLKQGNGLKKITRNIDKLIACPEIVQDDQPVLYQQLMEIHFTIEKILKSNENLLFGNSEKYHSQMRPDIMIETMFKESDCHRYVLECRQKKLNYAARLSLLTGGMIKDSTEKVTMRKLKD